MGNCGSYIVTLSQDNRLPIVTSNQPRSCCHIDVFVYVLTAVDSRVVNVLGYLSTTTPGQLFGIDAAQRVIVVSEDAGLTWMSFSPQRYAAAAVQIANKEVPWIWDSTNLPAGTAVGSTYSYGSWGGMYN
jgi:hypothetical protein